MADRPPESDLAHRWHRARVAEAEIREQMARVRCSCFEPGALAEDGRCWRCWGWPKESEA